MNKRILESSIYRERFACTLAKQTVDRPPMDLASTDMTEMLGGPRRLASLLGVETSDETVLKELDTDIRGVGGVLAPESALTDRSQSSMYRDCWGIGYTWIDDHYEISFNPLKDATIDDLGKYPWPKAEDIPQSVFDDIASRASYLACNTPYVVCARHPYFGVMELGCWMCGFEDFLYRMAAEPEFIHRFFEIVFDYQKRVNDRYYGAIGEYCHFTTSGDDFGTQTGPFLSPALFDALIKPYFKARIDHIRTYTDAAFFHHSCGSVFSLIPSLIDAGVQILNPIQPHAKDMDPDKLKASFGDRLVFYGGIDTQHLLPEGSVEEVASEVHRLVDTLAPGYILSAAHTIQSDVPLENVVAMYQAGRRSK